MIESRESFAGRPRRRRGALVVLRLGALWVVVSFIFGGPAALGDTVASDA